MPTTIFWPADVKQDQYAANSTKFCYGWSQPALCVAGALEAPSEQYAQNCLNSLRTLPEWLPFVPLCGSDPVILGQCTFKAKGTHEPSVPTLDSWSWITGEYNIIFYHRHDMSSLRFYSLDILDLDPGSGSKRKLSNLTSLYTNSIHQDFTRPRFSSSSGINAFVINQFNTAKSLQTMLEAFHKPGFSARFQSQWALVPSLFSRYLTMILTRSASFLSKPTLFLSSIMLAVCGTPLSIPFLFSSKFLLKDISATFQQIDVRAEQSYFLIHQSFSLRRHAQHIPSVASFAIQYVSFYNTVWLILNDITIGLAFGSFLCENHVGLAELLNDFIESSLISWVHWALTWLSSWPAGLKLNTELSRFYTHTFIDLTSLWGHILSLVLKPSLPTLIYLIGTAGSSGVTTALVLLSDFFGILTVHIYICYILSTSVYWRSLRMAGSLWRLFRGKRYNVLRNRTDSWSYDIDQLLFGTISFTLLAFLFPTVLAYYTLFAMLRLCSILMHATLDTLLALMNHFPLFAFMLRVKDPWRLPGGIFFLVVSSTGSRYPSLIIKNQPIPLSSIFYQYSHLRSRLFSHYNPLRLLRCILSGDYLTSIPRYSIRYDKNETKEGVSVDI